MEHIIGIIHAQIFASILYICLKSLYLSNFNIFCCGPFVSISSGLSWVFLADFCCCIKNFMVMFLGIDLSLFLRSWSFFNQISVLGCLFNLLFLLGEHLLQMRSQILGVECWVGASSTIASDLLLFIVFFLSVYWSNILSVGHEGLLVNGNIILALNWSICNILVVSISFLWVCTSLSVMIMGYDHMATSLNQSMGLSLIWRRKEKEYGSCNYWFHILFNIIISIK